MRQVTKGISIAVLCLLCTTMVRAACAAEAGRTTASKTGMAKESRGKAPLVGVSWSNFQEERWKRDEAAITKVLAKYGAEYISADAEASNDKQMRDIDTLVARGAKAIIVLAWDADAILPAIERAKQHGVAIIAYDRLIQSRNVFYITFDNVEVGRIQAREILKRQPQGDYAFIKGAATDPNSTMLYKGQMEVLDSALRRGDIRNVGDQFTEGWKPENARRNMLEMLRKNRGRIDAVVASNDGTAGGVIDALHTLGLKDIPVSGQDCDTAALNRIARGQQSVSVFKDPRKLGEAAAWVASELAQQKRLSDIVGTIQWAGGSRQIPLTALLLRPLAITARNLELVLASRWISKEKLCAGVDPKTAPSACR